MEPFFFLLLIDGLSLVFLSLRRQRESLDGEKWECLLCLISVFLWACGVCLCVVPVEVHDLGIAKTTAGLFIIPSPSLKRVQYEWTLMVCWVVGRETARDVNLHIETFPWPDMKQSIPQHTFWLWDLTLKYHQDVWVAIGSYG